MIETDDDHLMMIEPKDAPEAEIDDEITEMARKVLASCEKVKPTKGFRVCTGLGCREISDSCTHVTPGGLRTNSLLVHYVARHRTEVPRTEIAKLIIEAGGLKESEVDGQGRVRLIKALQRHLVDMRDKAKEARGEDGGPGLP